MLPGGEVGAYVRPRTQPFSLLQHVQQMKKEPTPAERKAAAVVAFKELLSEKGVTPFSLWERELPKLSGDGRYKALPNAKDRRAAFDEYVKEVASGAKTAGKGGAAKDVKAAGAKAGIPVGARTRRDAAAVVAAAVQQREVEEEEMEAEEDDHTEADGFMELLEEVYKNGLPDDEEGVVLGPGFSKDTRLEVLEAYFSHDPRWIACPAHLRQRLFERQKRNIERAKKEDASSAEAAYRALLRETCVASTSRWSKTKDSLADDPRYKALDRDVRERVFREYVAELGKQERKRAKEEDAKEKEVRSSIQGGVVIHSRR